MDPIPIIPKITKKGWGYGCCARTEKRRGMLRLCRRRGNYQNEFEWGAHIKMRGRGSLHGWDGRGGVTQMFWLNWPWDWFLNLTHDLEHMTWPSTLINLHLAYDLYPDCQLPMTSNFVMIGLILDLEPKLGHQIITLTL